MLAAQSKTAGKYSSGERKWAWTGFYMMTTGVIITTIFILLNEACVLYTFYAPLMAHPGLYIGLALVTVGSWVVGRAMSPRHYRWRKEKPRERAPRSRASA